MRIVLVVEQAGLGGAELSFLELARALAPRCDLHLVMGEDSASSQSHLPVFNSLRTTASLHILKGRLNPGTLSLVFSPLRRRPAREVGRVIAAIHPDVVVVNLPTVERGQTVVDGVTLVSPRPPVWGFLHLAHRPSTIGAKLGWLRDSRVRRLLGRFDRLITVSHVAARQLVKDYGVGPAEVVHPPTPSLKPVSGDGERSRLRGEAGLPDGILLGMVGRVQVHHKGQDVALRVVASLLASCPLHLVVIGDGPDLPHMRRLTEDLGITSHVSFLGWRNDTPALIPLLDAVLLPSRFEGLPQTALQAATAGVPVIGFAVDGLAELLPPDFQVPYGDEPGLAAAVLDLLKGVRHWPAREMAARAAAWGDPVAAAERILTILNTGSSSLQQDAAGIQEVLPG
jgi:glycosyltransferase involved in cell wall biosynthesis